MSNAHDTENKNTRKESTILFPNLIHIQLFFNVRERYLAILDECKRLSKYDACLNN